MALADRFRHTLTVERATAGAVSARGHAAQTWTTHLILAGLVQERSGREVEGPNHEAVISNALIFVPSGTDVTERDRIVANGYTYDLLVVRDPGGRGRHLEIDARRVMP